MKKFDFGGWATRNNLRCSDGRTILRDAFKENDGQTVPLVWNHRHDESFNVLGHALLENREDGVYAYCTFNDTEAGRNAKLLVQHGDVNALSIYANRLKQQGSNVIHGAIREVSLVLAGANPGAYIDSVMCHGEMSDEEAVIYTGEPIYLAHSANDKDGKGSNADMNNDRPADKKNDDEETVADVFDTLTEKQKTVVYAMIGQALEDANTSGDNTKEDHNMKHNVFDCDDRQNDTNFLSHSEQADIIGLAKTSSVGSLQDAISIFAEQNDSLAHGIDDIESLFPDYKDVHPGAPELIQNDQGWVSTVIEKAHKSPISRIRTRQMDIRSDELRAKGYKKGDKKALSGNVKLLKRTTDPQTVYRKDALHRDDIIDITDFDVVEYQYNIMKQNLKEEIARAIMIGDGRDEGDDNKISEEHIRSIWNDDDLYTIHVDVDIDAAKAELQGTNTGANFGENYVYAEAIITASLYARERYKGSGTLDFYCTPHLLNVMLLARDLNGRRMHCSAQADGLPSAPHRHETVRWSSIETRMQVDFLVQELRTDYPAVWRTLTTADNVRAASDAVMLQFEHPADTSETVRRRRAQFGAQFYEKLAGTAQGIDNDLSEGLQHPPCPKQCPDTAGVRMLADEIRAGTWGTDWEMNVTAVLHGLVR